MTTIQVYVPIEDASEEEKNHFYRTRYLKLWIVHNTNVGL